MSKYKYIQIIIIIVFAFLIGWLACKVISLEQTLTSMQNQLNKHELMIRPAYLVEHKLPANLKPKMWR